MVKPLFGKVKKIVYPNEIVEVKIFQNKTNKQFNLPVLKKSTSPQIIKDIFDNKDIIGLKFKITDLIFKDKMKGKVFDQNFLK